MTDETSTGVAADNTNNTNDSNSTDTNKSTSNDKTNENTKKNDPEKNKTLAEITIMESLRDIPSYTIRVPRLIEGIHTNSFFYCEVPDDFYEKNYPELIKAVANTKFARYAGFRKNWFYIDKVEQEMGDEWYTEISFNPIPTSLGEYVKLRQEAEKALIQAMNSEKNAQNIGSVGATTGGGGVAGSGDETSVGLTNMSGKDCTDTWSISVKSRTNIDASAKHQIGNSSANYAVDTAQMTAKQALMDTYKRFKYSGYSNNRTCPQRMWNKSGTIRGNCADISRLIMCLGQVHGLKVGISHITNGSNGHYFNMIDLNGKTYLFDCCFKSTGYAQAKYGGGMVNNLTKNGGPWTNA